MYEETLEDKKDRILERRIIELQEEVKELKGQEGNVDRNIRAARERDKQIKRNIEAKITRLENSIQENADLRVKELEDFMEAIARSPLPLIFSVIFSLARME